MGECHYPNCRCSGPCESNASYFGHAAHCISDQAATARTLELVAEWASEDPEFLARKLRLCDGDPPSAVIAVIADAIRSGAFAEWLKERETRGS